MTPFGSSSALVLLPCYLFLCYLNFIHCFFKIVPLQALKSCFTAADALSCDTYQLIQTSFFSPSLLACHCHEFYSPH